MKMGFYFVLALIFSVSSTCFSQVNGERALYLSGNQTLVGCIYRPTGSGPFPAVVFNQNSTGSLNQSGPVDPFPALAKIFTQKGYVLFVPGRHELGESENDKKKDTDASIMHRHEAHAANIIAAVAWVKAQHDVDDRRVAVIGDNAGAASTLFTVNKGLNVRAVVVFSPATRKLGSNYALQSRLKHAVEKCTAPIFLIQPENDLNLLPKAILGPVLETKGTLNQTKVYPAYGDAAADAQRFMLEGYAVWQRDVMTFLSQAVN